MFEILLSLANERKALLAARINKEFQPSLNEECFLLRDIFSLGFGPFRWVCTSGDPQDLATTDSIAMSVLEDSIRRGGKAASHAFITGSGFGEKTDQNCSA